MYRFEQEIQDTRMDIYLRFILALLFIFLLTRWLTRISDPTFSWQQLVLALGAKVLLGCLYGYVYLRFYGGDDTWLINADSLNEMRKLLDRPRHFFEDIALGRLVAEHGWQKGLALFRMKLEQALIIKPLSLVNLFSKGNYYSNVVFFSGISFWGHWWFYQACRRTWPAAKNVLFLLIFLYPPTLFWFSGIRTDAWLFFFFGLLIYQYKLLLEQGNRWRMAGVLLGMAGMVVVRAALLAVLLPALMSWWLVQARGWKVAKAFLVIHGAALLFFLLSGMLPAPLNLMEVVAQKQAEFSQLEGNTRVPLDMLTADPRSYIKILPQALDNAFLQPRPWASKNALQLLAALQNTVMLLLLITFFVRRYAGRRLVAGNVLMPVLLFFGILSCLFIGYTIPFPGALIRYRALPETCLLVWLVLAAWGDRLSHYKLINVYKN